MDFRPRPSQVAGLAAAVCIALMAAVFVSQSNVGPAFAAMKSDRQQVAGK